MKTLFLVSNLNNVGGIQRYCRDFLSALSESSSVSKVELKKSSPFWKIVFIITACAAIFKNSPRLIVCAHINFSPLCHFLRKVFGVEYIVLTYGIEVWNIKSSLKKKSLRSAQKIITISQFTKRKLTEQFPELESKISIVSNAVDGAEFSIDSKPDDISRKLGVTGNKVVLTVCRLSAQETYKGYEKIIGILPAIIKEIPDVKYVLAGSGNDSDHIRSMVHNLQLDKYVIMPGYVPDGELASYYNLCDAFIMLSKSEGLGFVFLEALACGRPVIAGNQDGSREAVLNGEIGVLVDPDNDDEITRAIVDVLKGNADQKFLNREYLRNKVLEAYSVKTFKERVGMLLDLKTDRK
ncbi:MAG: glycosyltransferase family 4 protein [Candidatus Jorgensenbacteria bacterium]|nr:glycosyltransferase family 4 protein [Candidatus Jorgensenbacteria bacterium]